MSARSATGLMSIIVAAVMLSACDTRQSDRNTWEADRKAKSDRNSAPAGAQGGTRSAREAAARAAGEDPASAARIKKRIEKLPVLLSGGTGTCSVSTAKNLSLSERERQVINEVGTRAFAELISRQMGKARVNERPALAVGDLIVIPPLSDDEINGAFPVSIVDQSITEERAGFFEMLIAEQLKAEFTREITVTLRRHDGRLPWHRAVPVEMQGLAFELKSIDRNGHEEVTNIAPNAFPGTRFGAVQIHDDALQGNLN